ncbi:MAG TPA: helix-turn-helix domain-containing protein [Leptolyngbyaceae cyanobacterium M33_DOE_097]|nr:helix-turn-helix domain-containing protein [Leptolyngbyaceae cyanobacterium M33_DOE_097]
MSGVLKTEIQESVEELKTLLNRQTNAVERSKLQILWWLKQKQVTQVNELAQLSGYHRITVSRWLSRYRAVDGDVRQQLIQELEDAERVSSYGEIQRWLAAIHGQVVPYKTIHKTVRYGLKGKLKRPRPVSEKQPVGAVEAFKETLAPTSTST